ncbi:MAG: DUF3592 domain-containing protein [Pseudomonadota bacterium]
MNYYSLKKVKPSRIRAARWVLAATGLVFLAIGVSQLYGAHQFTRVALPAQAVVQSVERKISSDREGETSVTYRPTVTYRDAFGATRTARTLMSSSGYDYPVGAEIAVLYDQDDPTTVRVDGFLSLWLFGTVFAAVGALLLALGAYMKPSMGDQSGDGGDDADGPPAPKTKRWNNTVRRR